MIGSFSRPKGSTCYDGGNYTDNHIEPAAGMVELFSKFRDEPFRAVNSKTAWAYVLLNILISLAAFFMIVHSELLGTAELMRSKFLKINVRGKEAVIGPEMIINVFLETLERKIDRERALMQKTLVEQCMTGIDLERSLEYAVTTVQGTRQTASPEVIREPVDNVEKKSANFPRIRRIKVTPWATWCPTPWVKPFSGSCLKGATGNGSRTFPRKIRNSNCHLSTCPMPFIRHAYPFYCLIPYPAIRIGNSQIYTHFLLISNICFMFD